MNRFFKTEIIASTIIIIASFASVTTSVKNSDKDDFEFIMAADWRHFATERYHSSEYFQGALEAIRDVGKGSFMVSHGDFDPVADSEEIIKTSTFS